MTINSINKNQEALNTPLKYYYRDVIDGCWTEATKYKVFSNPDKPKSKIRYSYVDCWKCDGRGVIDHYRYHDQGICYKCHDQKVLKTRVWTKEQTEKLNEKQSTRDAKREKEAEEYRIANEAKFKKEAKEKRLAEEKRLVDIEAEFKKMEYVGTIGEKIELEVRIVFQRTFNGNYGMSTMYSMEDNNGNSLVYWQSGYGNFPRIEKKEKNGELLFWCPHYGSELKNEEQEKFLIKAIVKDHRIYERKNGFGEKEKQTILARPKTIRAVGEQHWQNIGTWK